MNSPQKKKTAVKKTAPKTVKPATSSGTAKAKAVTFECKPGSLLGQRGSMVPTVQLSKRAASRIS